MNIKHVRRLELRLVLARMNAVDRADVDTRGILRADAGFADDIRHSQLIEQDFLRAQYNSELCRVQQAFLRVRSRVGATFFTRGAAGLGGRMAKARHDG